MPYVGIDLGRGDGPLREVVLDTETTGLKPEEGHRIIEIGCLELINHLPSGGNDKISTLALNSVWRLPS